MNQLAQDYFNPSSLSNSAYSIPYLQIGENVQSADFPKINWSIDKRLEHALVSNEPKNSNAATVSQHGVILALLQSIVQILHHLLQPIRTILDLASTNSTKSQTADTLMETAATSQSELLGRDYPINSDIPYSNRQRLNGSVDTSRLEGTPIPKGITASQSTDISSDKCIRPASTSQPNSSVLSNIGDFFKNIAENFFGSKSEVADTYQTQNWLADLKVLLNNGVDAFNGIKEAVFKSFEMITTIASLISGTGKFFKNFWRGITKFQELFTQGVDFVKDGFQKTKNFFKKIF